MPTYLPADFEKMIREQKPDFVIVCTTDATHHEYIVRALEVGVDVIAEKPLTIDAEKCRKIFDAVKNSGKTVRTTFNSRWMASSTKIREAILSGAVGQVKQVHLEYMLDTSHGADYFRRWHSQKEVSGGLLFYGRANAAQRGLEPLTRYDRYTGNTEAQSDPFCLDLDADPRLTALDKNAEAQSGFAKFSDTSSIWNLIPQRESVNSSLFAKIPGL